MKDTIMGKVGKHFALNWKEYASAAAVIVIIVLAQICGFDLWGRDLTYPLRYDGMDDISVLVDAKTLQQNAWVLSTDRLGVPYGTSFTDFSANMLNNAGAVVLKIFVMITQNVGLAANLTFLSAFVFAGLVSYFVMRELKVANWIAVLASAVFGTLPYLAFRSLSHIVLVECYFIPLSVLLCIWIYERDDVLCFNRKFFKNPRNYLAILFTLLIANNGIAYYPFFTCYLLVVTAFSKVVKTKKLRYAAKSVVLIACISFFLVMSLLPGMIYTWQHGSNDSAVVRGGFPETEVYGLKIIQMFIPIGGHGIDLIQRAINAYNGYTYFLNENIMSYLGIMAIVGFIMLMAILFMRQNNTFMQRLGLLAEMDLMLVLLGTTGGLGTMFAYLVSDMIRSYNRVSIVICYVSILAAALVADRLYKKYKRNAKDRVKLYAACGVFVLLAGVSIWDSYDQWPVPDYEGIKAEYDSDRNFVARIEGSVDAGAMIYQLPYHSYPEGGIDHDMMDHDPYIGYIHSDTLRWTYAAVRGREGGEWSYNISRLSPQNMVNTLKSQGFAGIYIDRRAYDEKDRQQLEAELQAAVGSAPIESENGNQSFFKF